MDVSVGLTTGLLVAKDHIRVVGWVNGRVWGLWSEGIVKHDPRVLVTQRFCLIMVGSKQSSILSFICIFGIVYVCSQKYV